MTIEKKYNLLKENLRQLGKVLVAYSGGVDSTFLLKVAVDTLGKDNVIACIFGVMLSSRLFMEPSIVNSLLRFFLA